MKLYSQAQFDVAVATGINSLRVCSELCKYNTKDEIKNDHCDECFLYSDAIRDYKYMKKEGEKNA